MTQDTKGRTATGRGVGLPVAAPEDVVLEAAGVAKSDGFISFWLNNPPGSHALQPLGQIARSTESIALGVGVIPLSDHSPEEIAREVRDNGLVQDRFWLGLGSGSGGGGVARVERGLEALQGQVRCSFAVAALGPRMCRLAGSRSDGVLLNWITPDFARQAVSWIREGADAANRRIPRLMAYVRVALGAPGVERLRREAASYEAIPHYGAHFQRMGASALETAVSGDSETDIQNGLSAWDGVVDEVIVRIVAASDTSGDVLRTIAAARPR